MVTQKIVRTNKGKKFFWMQKYPIETAFDLIKCLKHIK